MATDPPPDQRSERLGPEAVSRANFGTSFRGFDQDEVRVFLVEVAEALREARDREADLRAQLGAAQRQAAGVAGLDPTELTAAVGEETARVLGTAHEAAGEIRSRAEEHAARVRAEADEVLAREVASAEIAAREVIEASESDAARRRLHADRLVADAEKRAQELLSLAESDAGRRRDEAERTAAERLAEAEQLLLAANDAAATMRAEADEESARLQARGEEEAAAIVESARQQGRELVGEAQAVRERVLGDLARRRKSARAQLEQLRAGRDRLLESYEVVRRTLDAATGELEVVLPEARMAADAAGRRVAAEPDDDAEAIEAELAAGRLSRPVSTGRESERAGEPAEPAVPGPDPEGTGAAEVGAPQGESESAEGSASEANGEAGPDDHGAHAAPADDVVTVFRTGAGRRSSRLGFRLRRQPVVPLPETELPALAPAEPFEEVKVVEPPAGDVSDVGDRHGVGVADRLAVDAIFARLRQGEAPAIEPEPESAAQGAGPPAVPSAEGEAEAGAEEPAEADSAEAELDEAPVPPSALPHGRSEEEQALLDRRDDATAKVESHLARSLKRALSNEQNDVLDQLRRGAGRSLDELVQAEAEHAAQYASKATSQLEDAATAGRTFLDGGGAGPEAGDSTDVGDLADELAMAIVRPLRMRLEGSLRDSEGDDDATVDGVRACYREWKTQRIGDTARHFVLNAFTRGLYESLPHEGHVRWLVDDGGSPCPDADDNALAGSLSRGEAFPTGHLYPPAHPGCRCLLVPESQ